MRFRPYAVAVASLIVALAFGFLVSGDLLYRAVIGLDQSGFHAGQIFQMI